MVKKEIGLQCLVIFSDLLLVQGIASQIKTDPNGGFLNITVFLKIISFLVLRRF